MRFRYRSITARLCGLLALALFVAPVAADEGQPLAFHLRFEKSVREEPFSGRVFVMLTRQETKELPAGVNWFKPEPVFARDVQDWQPGAALVIDAGALAFPTKLADLPKDTYSIHAVMDGDR